MVRSVEIVEVGPRDGLQNEKKLVSTADKVNLIKRAISAGSRRLEVASFVNPRRVPQMADAEDVVKQLGRIDGVTRIGLVLNQRGADRALACGIDQLGAVCIASDTFGIRNQAQTSDESVEIAKQIIRGAKAAGTDAQATIAVAFGCPFEGNISDDHVVSIAQKLAEADPAEIALADTIGVGVPGQVSTLVGRVREVVAPIPVRVHFHNTRNTGIANVWAAVEAGARAIDAAIGGVGGCPFAPGAAGNVATEDVIYMLDRSGVQSGLDFTKTVETSKWLGGILDKSMPSMTAKAGHFPVKNEE